MAKQAGTIFLEGTIDDLTYYKMEGRYYVRMKSSLTAKKFWRSKAFERSRESCKRFAEGNKLASKLYTMVEKGKRVYSLFCFLKKRAVHLLKDGKSLIEAEEVLIDYLHQFGLIANTKIRYYQTSKSLNQALPIMTTRDQTVSCITLIYYHIKMMLLLLLRRAGYTLI